jgi:predicted nuclease of predicted toxin-antitoxin system
MTTIWVDAHLPPAITTWITNNFDVTTVFLRELGLKDPETFEATKAEGAILTTKDIAFSSFPL